MPTEEKGADPSKRVEFWLNSKFITKIATASPPEVEA
jgi:hypothetical protein